jgi:hypothetical protein
MQFADTSSYVQILYSPFSFTHRHKLYLLSPGCIIIPHQEDTLHSSKLSAVVYESFPAEVVQFHRKFFNSEQGKVFIDTYSCVPNMMVWSF